MNSLKKDEGISLLNFEGSPGSQGPGPSFAPCLGKVSQKPLENTCDELFNFTIKGLQHNENEF